MEEEKKLFEPIMTREQYWAAIRLMNSLVRDDGYWHIKGRIREVEELSDVIIDYEIANNLVTTCCETPYSIGAGCIACADIDTVDSQEGDK